MRNIAWHQNGDLENSTRHLQVENRGFCTEKVRYVQGPHRDMLCEIVHQGKGAWTERRRTNSSLNHRKTTASDTLFPDSLNRTCVDRLISSKAREAVAGNIGNLISHFDLNPFVPT